MSTARVAIVTGAAQGIGRAIALRLADDGFDIGLNDIALNEEKLNDLAGEIEARGRHAYVTIADVSLESEVKPMVHHVVENLGGLDVVRSMSRRHLLGSCRIDGRERWHCSGL